MFRGVTGRLVTGAVGVPRYVSKTPVVRRLTDRVKDEAPFDASLLQLLVCPLSKKPLRYDAETNELINEELGIAYPIVGGIPNMIPQEARLIQKDGDASTTPTQG
ncbi:Protein preY, mitochondrial [Collichthys lucidus]|uniref:Protein preY, mitochondrial n=1 Tax=Collichthys lucidus TaxID=240159 RepID=A0A4U5UHP4_COLLU|nr:Protein preY, mitochondrial [Collichthys lucidus]